MEEYKKIIKKNFHNKKLINMFNNQLKFFQLEQNGEFIDNNKEIGSVVNLKEGTLIHGTRIEADKLSIIKETGLISPDFYSKVNKNKKKPWVVEFWHIKEETTLNNYLIKYCGCTIEFKSNDGKIKNSIISSLKDIEINIKKFKNEKYRDYIIYQNMEQRFLPNDYTNNSTMAFIVSATNETQRNLINVNVLDRNYDMKIQKKLFPKWFIKKYFVPKIYDNYETDREVAYLFGIPSTMIEGIIVNREIENNLEQLEKIKEIFNCCYICNIDGVVIK